MGSVCGSLVLSELSELQLGTYSQSNCLMWKKKKTGVIERASTWVPGDHAWNPGPAVSSATWPVYETSLELLILSSGKWRWDYLSCRAVAKNRYDYSYLLGGWKVPPTHQTVLISSSLLSTARDTPSPKLLPLRLFLCGHIYTYEDKTLLCLSLCCHLPSCPWNPTAILWQMKLWDFKLSAHWTIVWTCQFGYGPCSM